MAASMDGWSGSSTSGDVAEAFARLVTAKRDPIREGAKAAVKRALLGGAAPRDRIGRYEVLGPVARGGMGVVLRARDPQLHREVALKLVAPRPGEDPAREQARLLREGQALARLSHPNVVTIFDVGLHPAAAPRGGDASASRVYLAMELASGQSLRTWLTEAKRSRARVLRVFAAAGRGLAAAHAAGLVHRDFKPDNVMIGEDGRVRVVDFGLAMRSGDLDPSTSEGTDPSPSSASDRTRRSGTPGYAAPEQHRGAPATVAADVFAFSVTLHEALTGQRPRVPADVDRTLPRTLRRAIEAGLRPEPSARPRDLRAMLAVLDPSARDRSRAAWRRQMLIGGFAVSLVGVGVGASASTSSPSDPVVADLGALGDRIGARALLVEAQREDDGHDFEAAERHARAALLAAAAAGDADTELDATLLLVHVVGWGQGRTDDAARLARSAEAIVDRLGGDPIRKSEVLAARASVAHARGDFSEAVDRYHDAIALRDETEAAPGAWWQALGVSLYRTDRLPEAIAAQGVALERLASQRGADHPDRAVALVSRAQAHLQLDEVEAGRADYREALEILERHHGAHDRALAIPLLNYGNLERSAGDLSRAAALHARYRAIVAATFPPNHHEHGRALVSLAEEETLAGDFDAAVTAASKAADVAMADFGEGHVRVAYALGLEGQALLQRGDTEAARTRFERAVASAELAFPATSPQLAFYLLLRCDAELALEDRDAARAGHDRAAAILAAAPGGHAPIRAHLREVAEALGLHSGEPPEPHELRPSRAYGAALTARDTPAR